MSYPLRKVKLRGEAYVRKSCRCIRGVTSLSDAKENVDHVLSRADAIILYPHILTTTFRIEQETLTRRESISLRHHDDAALGNGEAFTVRVGVVADALLGWNEDVFVDDAALQARLGADAHPLKED